MKRLTEQYPVFRIGIIGLVLLGTLTLVLGGAAGGISHAAQEGFPSQYFAPYVNVALKGDPFKDVIKDASSNAGTKYYTLAFVNAAAQGTCSPAWTGQSSPDMTYMQQEIGALQASGGDVIVSFGGKNADDPQTTARDLALTCATATDLQKAYQSVIDSYQLTHIDFDLEGKGATTPAVVSLRNKAIAGLQSGVTGKPLVVSYSLPIIPAVGLAADSLAVLTDAIAQKVTINYVNGIASDYSAPADPTKMGQNAVDAVGKLFSQLKGLYTQKSDSDLWSMIGITPMIGVNDPLPTEANNTTGGSQREIFTLADAQTVEKFAAQNKLHMLSLWELHRDMGPNGGDLFPVTDVTTAAPNLNSGIQQTPYQFSTTFNAFTGTSTGGNGQGNGSTCASVTAGTPLPWTGTLSTTDITASDWKTAWGVGSSHSFGLGKNLTISNDPTSTFGNVLKVHYPAQAFDTQGGGGFEARPDLKLPTDKRDDLFLHYCVLFPQGFDFGRGGKLPGISAGTGPYSGGTSPQNDTQGFSARLMWRTGTLTNKVPPYGEAYVYVQKSMLAAFANPQGYKVKLNTNGYGTDVQPMDQSSWPFKADNAWHAVQEEVKLNTPGKSDGSIHIWLDEATQDKPVLDAEGLMFRNTADLDMSKAGLDFQTFFGGHDASWAPSKDEDAYFTNIALSDQYIGSGSGQFLCPLGDTKCDPHGGPCSLGQAQQTPLYGISGLSIDIASADQHFCTGQKESFTLTVKGDMSGLTLDANGKITVTAMISAGIASLAQDSSIKDWQITFNTTTGPALMTAVYTGTVPIASGSSLPPITFSGTFSGGTTTAQSVTIFASLMLPVSGQATIYAASDVNLTLQPLTA